MGVNLEAVIFDLDETLHARAPSVVRFAGQLHREAALDMSEAEFVDLVLSRDERGRRPTEGLYTWLANCFDLGKTAEQIVQAYRTTAWDRPVLYPDATETLRRLRPLRLGIVTNGSELSQAAKIRSSGLEAMTDAVAISGALGMRKPEPAIFREICGRLGVAPSRCVMVGDSPEHDIAGGRATRMQHDLGRARDVAAGPPTGLRRRGLASSRCRAPSAGLGVGLTPSSLTTGASGGGIAGAERCGKARKGHTGQPIASAVRRYARGAPSRVQRSFGAQLQA